MSQLKEGQIYSYSLSVLNLTLKVKFPCRLFLEHNGKPLTSEVPPATPNRFVFNQEISLRNDSERDWLEVVVQLVTEKGAKYVGGVLRLPESELIASEGERMLLPLAKCLDNEAVCEIRVDQVTLSRIKRQEHLRHTAQKSEFQPDVNALWSSQKHRQLKEAETKSEYNFPLSIVRNKDKGESRVEHNVIVNNRKNLRPNDSVGMDKEPALSVAGGSMSPLEFEVYKEGYNKLKEKYRKQAELARSQTNKRMAVQASENNLKLQVMRYKLKSQELEKALNDRSAKIKELNDSISALQKKELDIKYLKEEVENKNYTIKNLEETVKTLSKDHTELKGMQSQRYQSEQEAVRLLRDQVEKFKQRLEEREEEYARELKVKNEIVAKKDYELHSKSEELERAKCTIEDIEKNLTNKTFEWEKIQQSERILSKSKHEELKAKIAAIEQQRGQLQQTIIQLEQTIEDKNSQMVKIDYQKRIILQNGDNMQKEIDELKTTKEKYIDLSREHKLLQDQRNLLEKHKEREIKQKQQEIDQITQKLTLLSESSRKTIKDLEEKLKTAQLKSLEADSHNETLRTQLQKMKRISEATTKEVNEARALIKQLKKEIKDKENSILTLNSQLNQSKNRTNQSDYSIRLELNRTKQELEKMARSWEVEKLRAEEIEEMMNINEQQKVKLRLEWQLRQQRLMKDYSIAKERANSLDNTKTDLQIQLSTAVTNLTNSKVNEKALHDKIQKMELEAIKTKESQQKFKKDIKLLEEKLLSSDNNLKAKSKTIEELVSAKQTSTKRTNELETEITLLKNEIAKSNNDHARSQKINEILQSDLSKSKEEQTKLTAILNNKNDEEELLREEIKKQKEEYTKLDMKMNSLKKQYQKFKDVLSDNINTVFTSIPEGLYSPARSSKQISLLTLERTAKLHENSQILNTLASFGREARSNMVKIVEQLRQSQRQNERLNAEFSSSLNKNSSLQFEHNQAITNLHEEIEEIVANNQQEHDQLEEQIFSLEGKLREKEAAISELTQKVEELDYCWKTTKGDFDRYRDDSQKKDATKTKQICELKDQIDEQHNTITELQVNRQKLTETLDIMDKQIQENSQSLTKYERQLMQTKEELDEANSDIDQLKKELKKANEREEEQTLELITIQDSNQQLLNSLVEEEKKLSDLRQFVSNVIKEKEDIIKSDLEKGEIISEYSAKLESSKLQIEELEDSIRKLKKNEEENRDTIKKLIKNQKEIENSYNEQRNKANRLNEKLKDREGELNLKNDSLSKLQENLRKEKDRHIKYAKQLQTQIDELRLQAINSQKQYNQIKLSLENQIEKLTLDIAKVTETQLQCEEHLFAEKNVSENLLEQLKIMQENHQSLQESNSHLLARVTELQESLQSQQEELFKVQSKVYALEKNIEFKQQEKNEQLDNLHEDWCSKYESMCEEFEQRLQLVDKEKEYLKKKVEEKDKEIKKAGVQLKQQEINVVALKKNFDEKIKTVEQDRLAVLAQKNIENQRLIEEARLNFENLKAKESECRKLIVDLENSKASWVKIQGRLRETEEKMKTLNRNHLAEIDEYKKKEFSFKKIKENIANSIWKNERQVRNIVQASIRKILNVVDQTNTLKVMQVTKGLQQSILLAISIKIEES